MSGYQAWVYHRTAPPKLVTSVGAYTAALANGWADTPAAFTAPETPAPTPPVTPSATSKPAPAPRPRTKETA